MRSSAVLHAKRKPLEWFSPKQNANFSMVIWIFLEFFICDLVAEHPIPEEDRNLSRESDGERRVATPTATESQLPWKRQGDECTDAVQQNEFPAWASNKEYLAYNSPSATFLGNVYRY